MTLKKLRYRYIIISVSGKVSAYIQERSVLLMKANITISDGFKSHSA